MVVLLMLHHCLVLFVHSCSIWGQKPLQKQTNSLLLVPSINIYTDPQAPWNLLHSIHRSFACCSLMLSIHSFSQGKYKLSSPYLHLYDQIFFLMEGMQICPFLESSSHMVCRFVARNEVKNNNIALQEERGPS